MEKQLCNYWLFKFWPIIKIKQKFANKFVAGLSLGRQLTNNNTETIINNESSAST